MHCINSSNIIYCIHVHIEVVRVSWYMIQPVQDSLRFRFQFHLVCGLPVQYINESMHKQVVCDVFLDQDVQT